MKRLLKRKKNLFLQGTPGTGKTFCSRRVAWNTMGEKDDNHICQIQIHQSTSSNDMVAGYRPSKDGGSKPFRVRPRKDRHHVDSGTRDAEGHRLEKAAAHSNLPNKPRPVMTGTSISRFVAIDAPATTKPPMLSAKIGITKTLTSMTASK